MQCNLIPPYALPADNFGYRPDLPGVRVAPALQSLQQRRYAARANERLRHTTFFVGFETFPLRHSLTAAAWGVEKGDRPYHEIHPIAGPPTATAAFGPDSDLSMAAANGNHDVYKPERILITGGAGFIASHVTKLLVTKYPQYKVGQTRTPIL